MVLALRNRIFSVCAQVTGRQLVKAFLFAVLLWGFVIFLGVPALRMTQSLIKKDHDFLVQHLDLPVVSPPPRLPGRFIHCANFTLPEWRSRISPAATPTEVLS